MTSILHKQGMYIHTRLLKATSKALILRSIKASVQEKKSGIRSAPLTLEESLIYLDH